MRGSKYKTVRVFGAWKRSMKLLRMAKLKVSARRAVNDDRVNTSSDGFSVPSAVVEEERIAPLTPGVPSMPTAVVPAKIAGPSARLPPAATSGNASSSAHLRTHFLTREEIQAEARHCDTVQAELGAMPATQRKFEAMLPNPTPASATSQGEKFCLVQIDVLSNLLCCTVCKHCSGTGLTVQEGTKLGLAAKLEVVCPHCGILASSWTSPRQQDSRAFEVNIRSIMAIKQIGKGQTALNDFWAAMNISHRGLYHKTFQEHLKKTFREPEALSMDKFYAESAVAVKTACQKMDPGFCKDITVVYDGTWHKRGHTSHIGVGSVIEYHTSSSWTPWFYRTCALGAKQDPSLEIKGMTAGTCIMSARKTRTPEKHGRQIWEDGGRGSPDPLQALYLQARPAVPRRGHLRLQITRLQRGQQDLLCPYRRERLWASPHHEGRVFEPCSEEDGNGTAQPRPEERATSR
ncbi:unnamed protein product [Ixodes hexagonus]